MEIQINESAVHETIDAQIAESAGEGAVTVLNVRLKKYQICKQLQKIKISIF